MGKGIVKILVFGSLIFLLACSKGGEKSEAVHAEAVAKIRLGSGSLASIHHVAGSALCQILGKEKDQGIPCETLVSDGSVHNLVALHDGKIDLGIARADLVYRAWYGQPPFKQRSTALRVLFSLHQETATLVVPDEAGVATFRGIMGRRVNTGVPGSDDERVVLDILEACDLSVDHFAATLGGDVTQLSSGIKDHSIDAFFSVVGHPNDAITAVAREHTLAVLPLVEKCVEKLADERAYYDAAVIPGGVYRGSDADVPTLGVRVWVLSSMEVPEEAVYQVVKGVFENMDEFRKRHPAFYRLSPQAMLPQFSVPYHNGAVKYFAEKGWFVPEKTEIKHRKPSSGTVP
ncbi:MAG: TRAP transporter solute receptor, TAXI family [Magnetococcales bacterium]|nr:TRAP transporter solute receptor, TAXI family [Magnetococcales bacterium]